MDIDFVIMWVDGSDPEWLAEKRKYSMSTEDDDRPERYRDWDILRYWFRGVEKFAPWVGKIHFVTWGHLPKWLDTSNPKINVVNHKDIIPNDILPVFNSCSIEAYLYRIEGLAEHFVYFNDDMMLISPTSEEIFFKNGLPVDMLAFQPVVANPKNPVMSACYMNNSILLAKHFDKRTGVKARPFDYFHLGYPPLYFFYNFLELAFPLYTGFYTVHNPSPYLKSTFETVWKEEGEALARSTANRFRGTEDLSQYVFREWQKLSGNFVPKNILKYFRYFEVDNDNTELIKTITKQTKKMICVNDTGKAEDQDAVIESLQKAFDSIMPEKSSFEK